MFLIRIAIAEFCLIIVYTTFTFYMSRVISLRLWLLGISRCIILYRALYFWSLVNVGCFARANFPVWEYCTRVSTDDTVSVIFITCAESWLLNGETSPVFFKIS
jgi:hypothetical protein